jgi:hypothetical protein
MSRLPPLSSVASPIVFCTACGAAGLITPKEALEEACKNLKAVCAHMKSTFREEMRANQVPVTEDAAGGDDSSGSGGLEATAMQA